MRSRRGASDLIDLSAVDFAISVAARKKEEGDKQGKLKMGRRRGTQGVNKAIQAHSLCGFEDNLPS